MTTLDHERLDAYHLARRLSAVVQQLAKIVPKGHSDLVDQLRRASSSIVLNIAEGAGEYQPKEKARFYRIARRSTTETAAILDLLTDAEALTGSEVLPAKEIAPRLVGTLVGLVKGLERAQ